MNPQNSLDRSLIRILQCPTCSSPLKQEGPGFTCYPCEKTYARTEGVIRFLDGDNLEYISQVDLTPEEFSQLREVLKTRGLGPARDYLKSRSEWLDYYVFGCGRADWLAFTDLPPHAVALDLGCGWGALTMDLLSDGISAFAVDRSASKLELLATRAAASGSSHVVPVCWDFTRRLPFAENSFDLVILNGVLEWTAEFLPGGSPRIHQLTLLREARRVLRPGGQLYVGIENRFGYKYLLGASDDHTGLRLANVLPRPVATIQSRLVRGRPYRTYTYSAPGIRRLLRRAGFHPEAMYYSAPSYKQIDFLVPLEGKLLDFYYKHLARSDNYWSQHEWVLRPLWSTGGRRVLQLAILKGLRRFPRMFALFVPSLSIVARKVG